MWWYLAALVSAGMVYGCSRYLAVANPKDGTPKWAYIGGIIVFAFGAAGAIIAGIGADEPGPPSIASDSPQPLAQPNEGQTGAAPPKPEVTEAQAGVVATHNVTEAEAPPTPHRATISGTAYTELTKDSSPRLYKVWGASWASRINAAVQAAINIAAQSPDCDNIWGSGLSSDRSTPKEQIVVFAYCTNGTKFFYTEEEALAGIAVASLRDKAKERSKTAMRECRELIKTQARHPSTVSFSMWSDTIEGEFGQTLEVPFTAKNSFGLETSHIGYCNVSDRGVSLMSIKAE